jgi:putative transposase
MLGMKAQAHGRVLVKVDPAYTSQDCSGCGHREPKALSERVHRCQQCGLELDRDVNAARNIKQRAFPVSVREE